MYYSDTNVLYTIVYPYIYGLQMSAKMLVTVATMVSVYTPTPLSTLRNSVIVTPGGLEKLAVRVSPCHGFI